MKTERSGGELEQQPGGAAATRPQSQRRARFESIDVSRSEPGRVQARVVLEWQEEKVAGEAEGDSSLAGSLRASALAAIQALDRALGGSTDFSLVGVKEMHVFDHDLVVVLLQSSRTTSRRMIGLAVIDDDRNRAAALAVLNATNRAVGMFNGG